MGFDLNYGVFTHRNTLQAVAVTTGGRSSSPYVVYPIGVGLPAWLPIIPNVIDPGCLRGAASYQWDLTFPEPAFEAQITPPGWFPFIGGETFGIPPTQAEIALTCKTDGTGEAEASGQTGFKVAGQEVEGKLSGKGIGQITEGKGVQLTDAELGFELSGEIKKKVGILSVIPALAALENTPIVGTVIQWFNRKANVEGTIEPAVDAILRFRNGNTGLEWNGVNGGGSVKLQLALVLDLITNGLTAQVYGGGEPSITLQVPPSPSYLKEVAAKLLAGVELQVWRFKTSVEASHEWSYSPGGLSVAGAPGVTRSESGIWHPIGREYAWDSSSYAVFWPAHDGKTAALADNGATVETLIASNVYPYANPALAVRDVAMLLYTHDDVAKPLMQGEEVYYSVYDGSSWSTPTGVTNDFLQDFSPVVAFDGFGHAVAVWERVKNPQPPDVELDADYTRQIEIAYAVWDGASWTPVRLLTDNDVLDHAPELVVGADGRLMLVWRQNAAGVLIGNRAHPDSFYSAIWDGSGWGAPVAVITEGSILGVDLAFHEPGQAALVFVQDLDQDLTTAEDAELFISIWNGNAWQTPIRLTDDPIADAAPRIFYDHAGVPKLVWMSGERLVAKTAGLTAPIRTVLGEAPAGVLGYAAAADQQDNLAILWQAGSVEGADIFYVTYDAQFDLFSAPEQLTHDRPLESSLAPAFKPNGGLMVAYNKVQLNTSSRWVSDMSVVNGVTAFGQTDLYVLTHLLGPDLSLSNADLVLSQPNPGPGDQMTITATLHNQGDMAVENPQVAFYQGDPTSGGTQIGTTQTVSGMLAGGMAASVAVTWTVPANGPHTVYVVADPVGRVSERNKANNVIQVVVSVPDLLVANAWVTYQTGPVVRLSATIGNAGKATAHDVRVAFYLDSLDGQLLGYEVATEIGSYSQQTVGLDWDTTGAATGWRKVYVLVDPAGSIPDANRTNNRSWFSVGVLPDLVLHSSEISTSVNADGTISIQTWVHNTGLRDAISSSVAIYDSLPSADGAPLAQMSADIPAPGATSVSIILSRVPRPGYYLIVRPAIGVDDRDPSDNMVWMPTQLVYLPLLWRAAP